MKKKSIITVLCLSLIIALLPMQAMAGETVPEPVNANAGIQEEDNSLSVEVSETEELSEILSPGEETEEELYLLDENLSENGSNQTMTAPRFSVTGAPKLRRPAM